MFPILMRKRSGFTILMGLCLASAVGAQAPPKLEALRLDAFEPVAGEAVFRLPDGRLEPVLEGKPVADTGATLVEVLVDRVVLERDSKQAGVRETVWMFPATERGKPSRIQVVSLVPPDLPDSPSPVVTPVETPASPPPR
jgi:hypothetical protein